MSDPSNAVSLFANSESAMQKPIDASSVHWPRFNWNLFRVLEYVIVFTSNRGGEWSDGSAASRNSSGAPTASPIGIPSIAPTARSRSLPGVTSSSNAERWLQFRELSIEYRFQNGLRRDSTATGTTLSRVSASSTHAGACECIAGGVTPPSTSPGGIGSLDDVTMGGGSTSSTTTSFPPGGDTAEEGKSGAVPNFSLCKHEK
mmetsp:Transcript_53370/g.72941  ORF Transcript_53370/g.72941 Transcript_53370/m.72941 type:complete len:202 (+) Transcript_53370:1166-1771(+)